MASMKIAGLLKTTTLDYPGKLACTVFLGGCNFRCPYCHNASLVMDDEHGIALSEEKFFDFLMKRKGVLDGVCITGGEPLLQENLEVFIRKIKDLGYLVKLDTNGSFPKRLGKIVESGLIDYLAMDLKHSKEYYGKAIGLDYVLVEKINESIQLIMKDKIPYEFRTTVVKGIHHHEDLKAMGDWIEGAKGYFLQNFEDSGDTIGGRRGSKEDLESFTEGELVELLGLVEAKVPAARIR